MRTIFQLAAFAGVTLAKQPNRWLQGNVAAWQSNAPTGVSAADWSKWLKDLQNAKGTVATGCGTGTTWGGCASNVWQGAVNWTNNACCNMPVINRGCSCQAGQFGAGGMNVVNGMGGVGCGQPQCGTTPTVPVPNQPTVNKPMKPIEKKCRVKTVNLVKTKFVNKQISKTWKETNVVKSTKTQTATKSVPKICFDDEKKIVKRSRPGTSTKSCRNQVTWKTQTRWRMQSQPQSNCGCYQQQCGCLGQSGCGCCQPACGCAPRMVPVTVRVPCIKKVCDDKITRSVESSLTVTVRVPRTCSETQQHSWTEPHYTVITRDVTKTWPGQQKMDCNYQVKYQICSDAGVPGAHTAQIIDGQLNPPDSQLVNCTDAPNSRTYAAGTTGATTITRKPMKGVSGWQNNGGTLLNEVNTASTGSSTDSWESNAGGGN